MAKKKLEDTPITNALAERRQADGRRKISLTRAERKHFFTQAQAETAAALFLDLEEGHKWTDIAEQLGISLDQLKQLVKSEEFDVAYNVQFAELGHDPRYRAAQAALADMLPLAMRRLYDLVSNPNTPPSVALRAIEKVLTLANVEAPQGEQFSQAALIQLLQRNNVHIDNISVEIPSEYQEGLKRWLPEMVEGTVTELPSADDQPMDEPDEVSDLD